MLTQEFLKSILHYDPLSGIFAWKERPINHFKTTHACKTWNTRFSGKKSGTKNINGYLLINIKKLKRPIFAHRLAWLYVYGVWPESDIDHINGIKDDNRIVNLREATMSENQQNHKKCRKDNKTGYLGVYFNRPLQKFVALIQVNNKKHHIGCFTSAEEAYEAYLKAKRELHPFCTI